MLEVDINKIIPASEARENFDQLVNDVAAGDSLYVLTADGKPSAVMVGVHHLEKLTGQSDAAIVAKMSDLANNNLGGNMEDTNMSSAAPADDTAMPAAAADTDVLAAAPTTPAPAADITPAAAPADEPVAAPEITPAAPAEEQIIPEPTEAGVDDPFAMSMPAETEAPEAPAAEAPVEEPAAAPETPVTPASDDADGNVLPNIGGQA